MCGVETVNRPRGGALVALNPPRGAATAISGDLTFHTPGQPDSMEATHARLAFDEQLETSLPSDLHVVIHTGGDLTKNASDCGLFRQLRLSAGHAATGPFWEWPLPQVLSLQVGSDGIIGRRVSVYSDESQQNGQTMVAEGIGTRPVCSPCLKRGGICVYTPPPTNTQLTFAGDSWFASDNLDAVLTDMPAWPVPSFAGGQLPGNQNVAMATGFGDTPSWLGVDSGIPMTETIRGLPTPEHSSPDSHSEPAMPALDAVLDLVDVFYEKFYSSMPMLHKGKLVARLQTQGVEGVPQLLLQSILAVASSGHPNPQIRANQAHWRGLAREGLKKSIPTEAHPLQTLQSALLLIFDALLQGDYPATWMMLGEAWRKAAVIGYHQVDARDNEAMVQYLGSVAGLDWAEREECRRVVWTFFIFDRGLCYPIGMVHAVDERRLVVNFPMSEDEFQGVDEPDAERPVLKYTNDLDRLIARVQEHGRQKASTLLHYIILAYVLLGRVTEEEYMQEAEDEKPTALDGLLERLVKIRLMLPGYASDLSLSQPGDVPYIIWLATVLSVSTIFLSHRAQRRDHAESIADAIANWPHAVLAARNMVQLLRDAYRSGSASTIMLSHTTAALFVSTRVLIMEYMCPGHLLPDQEAQKPAKRDQALRSDLQVLASASMQAPSGLGMLGKKFIIGFKFHIRMAEEDIRICKEYGAKGLLKRCGSWSTADDGEDIVIPE